MLGIKLIDIIKENCLTKYSLSSDVMARTRNATSTPKNRRRSARLNPTHVHQHFDEIRSPRPNQHGRKNRKRQASGQRRPTPGFQTIPALELNAQNKHQLEVRN